MLNIPALACAIPSFSARNRRQRSSKTEWLFLHLKKVCLNFIVIRTWFLFSVAWNSIRKDSVKRKGPSRKWLCGKKWLSQESTPCSEVTHIGKDSTIPKDLYEEFRLYERTGKKSMAWKYSFIQCTGFHDLKSSIQIRTPGYDTTCTAKNSMVCTYEVSSAENYPMIWKNINGIHC